MNTYKYITDKYKIETNNQYIISIPDIDRVDLAKLFNELNFKIGAEIGVDRGEYSEILCKNNPDMKLFGVDPYVLSAYEPDINPKKAGIHVNQEGFEGNYEQATKLLTPYPNYRLIRSYSSDALKLFKDNSLDFVYIDANHDFPNFIFDIHSWLKKVREDGIICGHDYANFSYKKHNHVKRALDAYTRCYRMQPLFIVGGDNYIKGMKRDKFRSWFWVKKEGGLR
jgi:hypothetical protein